MNILVTAGNTQAPIDRFRCVTNVHTGRTGTIVARTAWTRGHTVTLLTTHPELLADIPADPGQAERRMTVAAFRTYDELTSLLQQQVRKARYDAVVHAASVSDYICAGVYSPDPGTYFNARTREWEARGGPPGMSENKDGKFHTRDPELWLRMVRAPNLVDRVRPQWGYRGLFVMFKFEAGLNDPELLDAAENARIQADADLIVANTVESSNHWSFLGPVGGRYERVARRELPERLVLAVEEMRHTGSRSEIDV
jgi:phosphopantothenoylcysteine synthetase/decarboxylase